MNQHRIAAADPHQDVFGTSPEAQHLSTRQPPGQPLRKRPPQIRPVDLGVHDPTPLQPRLEASHHGLDLGEFRHRPSARYNSVPS